MLKQSTFKLSILTCHHFILFFNILVINYIFQMPIKESELIKCHDSKWTTPLLNVIYKVKIMKFSQYVIQVEIAIPAISSSKTEVNIKSQIRWVILYSTLSNLSKRSTLHQICEVVRQRWFFLFSKILKLLYQKCNWWVVLLLLHSI